MAALLEIKNLDVRFDTADGEVHAVRNADLTIQEGECLGVVGESGSGKSQLFLAAFGLLAGNGRTTGSVLYRGEEILGASQKRLNTLRGGAVTMIFQDPLTSLTPHMRVGEQIIEALTLHRKLPRAEAKERAKKLRKQSTRTCPARLSVQRSTGLASCRSCGRVSAPHWSSWR